MTATLIRPTTAAPVRTRQWELDALRVLAIAGVVAIHVVSPLVTDQDRRGAPGWWAAVAMDYGMTWVVPAFVLISGALVLAPRAHAAGPAAFYRRRFARILPALVVWHAVYLLGVRLWWRGEDLSVTSVLAGLINAKVFTALYFLWLIAGLYAIAPVLSAFLRDGGPRRAYGSAAVALVWTHLAYALAGVCALLGAARPLHLGAWTQWWPYVGLFLAGWALHRVVLTRRGLLVAAATGFCGVAEVVWQSALPAGRWPALDEFAPVSRLGPVVTLTAICFFLVAVGLGARITPAPGPAALLRKLSDASFGVFLVHLLILEMVRQVPEVARGSSLPVLLGAYLVVLVLSFVVSLGAARVRYLREIF